MKSSILYLAVLISILTGASSCREDYRWLKGEGPNVTNIRQPQNFEGINLSMDADVEVYKDSVFRVELNGQQNILNAIETYSSGSMLYIRLSNYTSIRKHNPITIKVYLPELNNLIISGSGDLTSSDNFSTRDLSATVSGSGRISFNGDIQNSFTAVISGSGSITNYSNSYCNSAKYTISGSGDIYSEWLRVGDADARISGSGDMKIFAVNTLNAKISGSGDIYYRGTPAISVQISGSGKLKAIQ